MNGLNEPVRRVIPESGSIVRIGCQIAGVMVHIGTVASEMNI
jgi:hypothetical protein